MKDRKYSGIHNDPHGAMNSTGNIIRDAWVFGIIPESETCEGWTPQRVSDLYDKVTDAWEPYGHMVSQLPDDIRQRHERIYSEAIKQAREKGWNPDHMVEDEA